MNREYALYLKRQKRARIGIQIARIGVLIAFFGLWELGAVLGYFDCELRIAENNFAHNKDLQYSLSYM